MQMSLVVPKNAPQTAQELTVEWGWTDPPKAIIDLAEEAVIAASTRSGDLFVARGVITEERKEALLRTKPSSIQTIDWLAQQDTACAGIADRLKAIKCGYPYYDSMNLLTLHEKMRDPAVIKRAEELDAALMEIEGVKPVLVFCAATSLYKYRAMGRQDRNNDPIVKALGTREFPLMALGLRNEISEVLKLVRTSENADSPNDGTNVWVPATKSSSEAREFARMMDYAVAEKITDVALIPDKSGGFTVLMRRNGLLQKPRAVSDKIAAQTAASLRSLLEKESGANPNNVEIRTPTDGQITYRSASGDVFLRLSFIPTNHPGEYRNLKSISIRVLPRWNTKINLRSLNLHPKVIKELRFAMGLGQGIILVVGPVNSGKSTTVAAIVGVHVEMYGETKKRCSVENPIERFLDGIIQFNVDDVERLPDQLKALKRHDPDFIWVGEVRDPETADMLVATGSAGNMAISTLHANDSVMGFDVLARIIPEDKRYQYIESLAMIVSQRLVPRLCPACRQSGEPTKEEREMYESYIAYKAITDAPKLPPTLYRPKKDGCKNCHEGYVGELPLSEVLTFNRKVKDAALALLEGRLHNGVSPRAVMEGERPLTLLNHGHALLGRGEIDLKSLLQGLPL